MHQVGQGQHEEICYDWGGQEPDALLLGAEERGYNNGVQQDIEQSQLISLGT